MGEEYKKPWGELSNDERMALVRQGVKKADYEARLNAATSQTEINDAVKAVQPESVESPATLESSKSIDESVEAVNAVTAKPEAVVPSEAKTEDKPQVLEVPAPAPAKESLINNILNKQNKKSISTDKFQSTGGRRLGLAFAGIAGGVAGLALFIWFMGHPNQMYGIVSILIMIASGIAVKVGFTNRGEGMVIVKGKSILVKPGVKSSETTNCLNIYPNRIVFENLPDEIDGKPNPLFEVHPRKCRNDDRYYYVNIWGTAFNGKTEKLVPFILPDTQYRDPREFSNNLNIPAHRKLAARRSSLFQKLSPILIIGAMVVVAILWIATTPAADQTVQAIGGK